MSLRIKLNKNNWDIMALYKDDGWIPDRIAVILNDIRQNTRILI